MAHTIEKLTNGLRVKHIKKTDGYYLYYGNKQILFGNSYQGMGFVDIQDAILIGNRLEPVDRDNYEWRFK